MLVQLAIRTHKDVELITHEEFEGQFSKKGCS